MSDIPSQTGGGRGGRRPGAGRPRTYRRITLDAEAAQELTDLLARYQERTPQAHWTASALVRYMITEAWTRERDGQRAN